MKRPTPLAAAIAAYLADDSTAAHVFGLIGTWDTRLVTDMSELFSGAGGFNGDGAEDLVVEERSG